MVFAYFAKAQLPFSLFRDLFNDTAEFTLCYGLHDCSPLFQGYFIHSLSTLYYYNAPSLATRLTGDYRDRTCTGKCSPALLDTRKKIRAAMWLLFNNIKSDTQCHHQMPIIIIIFFSNLLFAACISIKQQSTMSPIVCRLIVDIPIIIITVLLGW